MEWALLNEIKNHYKRILKEHLIGIYIHGSLAMGGFDFEKSDIDFIVVVNESLNLNQKKELIQVLLDLKSRAPKKGFEMSVVLEKYCQDFIYPTPYELHYSNMHHEAYQKDLEGYLEKLVGNDVDLASHFTIIYHRGITYFGKDKKEVFQEVPQQYYLDSIMQDVLFDHEDKHYLQVNLHRVLAFKEEGLILSKREAVKKYPQMLSIEEVRKRL